MATSFTDRYGMTLSTSDATAAEYWQTGLDCLLSQNVGPDEKFKTAIEHDANLAIAYGGLAFWYMQRARPDEAKATIQTALDLSTDITRRERQQIEAINSWIQGQGHQALAQLKAHLAEFPRDGILLRLAHLLYNRGCSSVGEPNFPPVYLDLLHTCAPYCDDDWAFLAEYAFAHHETGALEEAMDYAQRSLELNPLNAVATHSMTHVYFERGDAAGGADFLGNWLEGFDSPASSYVHLSWHLSLFELALGQYQNAFERYERDIRPSIVANSMATLADGASFLWRVQLYGGEAPPYPWEEVCTLATPMAERLGLAFPLAHAAMALASGGDQASLATMLQKLQTKAEEGDACTQDVVLPLVQGLAAFTQGEYATSANLLEPACAQLVRIGGSHAQREVFEDTLLEAYLRAEKFDKAEGMLTERLGRRASVRDTYWLGRMQAGQGHKTQAQTSFELARQSWQVGDADSPEKKTLEGLLANHAR